MLHMHQIIAQNLNGNIKGKNYFNSKTKTHTRFDCLLQYKL